MVCLIFFGQWCCTTRSNNYGILNDLHRIQCQGLISQLHFRSDTRLSCWEWAIWQDLGVPTRTKVLVLTIEMAINKAFSTIIFPLLCFQTYKEKPKRGKESLALALRRFSSQVGFSCLLLNFLYYSFSKLFFLDI